MVLKRIVRIFKIVFFVGFFGIISDFEGFLEMKKKESKGLFRVVWVLQDSLRFLMNLFS